MRLSFAEHLELLHLHGRAAISALGSLRPDASLPPSDRAVLEVATDHWATLEIWSWSLAHPNEHWSDREQPVSPADYSALVAGVAAEVDRLVVALRDAGPDRSLDYFGRPGTAAQVARLLAFEAVTMAHAAGLAAGRPAPALGPAAASDGVDHVLEHWESPQLEATWRPRPVAVRASDTRAIWHVSLPETKDDLAGDFRLVSAQTPAAVVEGPAENVLWWLHGHAEPAVSVVGDDADVRAVKSAFLQPVEKARRPKGRWFG